jgi:hypothetical protein
VTAFSACVHVTSWLLLTQCARSSASPSAARINWSAYILDDVAEETELGQPFLNPQQQF